MSRWRHPKTGLLWLGLLIPVVLYGSTIWQRPNATGIPEQPLFQGIVYTRRVIDQPRPNIVHIVDIDLTATGLRPLVTPLYTQKLTHSPAEKHHTFLLFCYFSSSNHHILEIPKDTHPPTEVPITEERTHRFLLILI